MAKILDSGIIQATGRRKTSVAQVRLNLKGEGKIIVNSKPLDQFFHGMGKHQDSVRAPLKVAEIDGKCDAWVKVSGGGVTGQAGGHVQVAMSKAKMIAFPSEV